MHDEYIDNTIAKLTHIDAIFNHKCSPNILNWLAKLHFNQVSNLPHHNVLKNTPHSRWLGLDIFNHLKVHVFLQFKHLFRHNDSMEDHTLYGIGQ